MAQQFEAEAERHGDGFVLGAHLVLQSWRVGIEVSLGWWAISVCWYDDRAINGGGE